MAFASPGWIAKHTLGEHFKLNPFLLGVVENRVGNGSGKTSGPKRAELFWHVPDDRHKLRTNSSKGASGCTQGCGHTSFEATYSSTEMIQAADGS